MEQCYVCGNEYEERMNWCPACVKTPQQRKELGRELRELEVCAQANKIIADPERLKIAFDEFHSGHGNTGLMISLSTLARCETRLQYSTHGSVLKTHVRNVAHWYAERQVKPFPAFLSPQAE